MKIHLAILQTQWEPSMHHASEEDSCVSLLAGRELQETGNSKHIRENEKTPRPKE